MNTVRSVNVDREILAAVFMDSENLSAHLLAEEYEAQYTMQNATRDCPPTSPVEAFYVDQFRKLLNHIPSKNLPVSSTNRFELELPQISLEEDIVLKVHNRSDVDLPKISIEADMNRKVWDDKDSENDCDNDDGITDCEAAARAEAPPLLRLVGPSDVDETAIVEETKVINESLTSVENRDRFSNYLRSKHAHRVRSLESALTWRVDESYQLICFFLKQLITYLRQYLMRM
jgi:hypothetical protein